MELTTIVGTPKKIIYPKNGDNSGFCILSIQSKLGRVTVKGNNLPKDNFNYEFTGEIETSKKYGDSLNVHFFTIVTNSRKDIVRYLSKTVSGVGEKTAEKLYSKYGADVMTKIKDYRSVLAVVKSVKKAEKISKSAMDVLIDPKLFELISKYRLKPNMINKSEKTYKQIKKDPFCLAGYAPFYKMNKMALDFGCDLTEPTRLKSGIMYVLNEEISRYGNTYCTYEELVARSLKILNEGMIIKLTEANLKPTFRELYDKKNIVLERQDKIPVVFSRDSFNCEMTISKQLMKFLKSGLSEKNERRIDNLIKQYAKEENIKLAEAQKEAIKTAMTSPVSIITGSAGTGKTTVLKACLSVIDGLYGDKKKCLLLAPTGRAAKVMMAKTNHKASTIHSRLEIDGDGNIRDTITEDIIFIDEMSMTDSKLMATILENISKKKVKIVFLGDPNQLPSVGAGNVLEDLINSGTIPTTKLSVIYRQKEGGRIVHNALNILEGRSELSLGDDFEFVEVKEDWQIKDVLVDKFISEIQSGKDIMSCQIITPMKTRGKYSQFELNNSIQSIINPINDGDFFVNVNNYRFHKGDKIICQKNYETLRNGDIGIITDVYIDEDDDTVVDFNIDDKIYTFQPETLRDLGFVLAYAITIHKSQGSEFEEVFMPIGYAHMGMLKRNLLYTAVTRASKKMALVGNKSCYEQAVKNNLKQVRYTGLRQRLIKIIGDDNYGNDHNK